MSKAKQTQNLPLFSGVLVTEDQTPEETKKRQQTEFTSTKDLLSNYQLSEKNQHIAHEFQSFGCYLAETLADKPHTSLYIKLAKTLPRGILERALSFVIDANADNKAKLFMWKLQQLKTDKSSK